MSVQRGRRDKESHVAGGGKENLIPKSTAAKVAKLVNQIRKAKNMNENDLARGIGVARSVLYKLEHEHRLGEGALARIKRWAAGIFGNKGQRQEDSHETP